MFTCSRASACHSLMRNSLFRNMLLPRCFSDKLVSEPSKIYAQSGKFEPKKWSFASPLITAEQSSVSKTENSYISLSIIFSNITVFFFFFFFIKPKLLMEFKLIHKLFFGLLLISIGMKLLIVVHSHCLIQKLELVLP